jgi:transcriptional regulator with XRE-family HTH domain
MNPRSDIHDRLAASLREARKARGLSLDAVAKLSGVSRSMVSQIERGESSPTVATLWNLTQALQVDFAGLLEGKPEPGIVVMGAPETPSLV